VRVFLDASVIFSAAYRETGSVRAFFHLAAAGACVLVTSGYAVDEARRNIALKHPRSLRDLEMLVDAMELCDEPSPAMIACAAAAGLPPKDAPILAAALEAGCHILATGDRSDLGTLLGKRMRGTLVMLPVDAIGLLID
jgi:uncharacterized protein